MKSTRSLNRINPCLVVAVLLVQGLTGAYAATDVYYTNNAAATYNNASYWDPNGVPDVNNNVINDNGAANVVQINAGDPDWSVWDIRAGNNAYATGAFMQNGPTVNVNGWFRMGLAVGTTGYYTLSNGTVNAMLQIHIGEVGTGYLEVDGGTLNALGGGGQPFAIGDGDFGNGTVGTLTMNDGTINSASEIWVGQQANGNVGTGYLNIHGGTLNATNWLVLGRFGAKGYVTMDGGNIVKTSDGNIQIGVGAVNGVGAIGVFNQSAGTITAQSEWQVGTDNALARGTNNISGTAVLTVNNWLAVGRGGAYGELNLSGNASVTKTGNGGNHVTIGTGSAGVGVINQSGGTFTSTNSVTWLGENNIAIWNLNDGAAVFSVIHLGQNAGANGTFNLNGGDLTATEMTTFNGSSGTFNFNGGTLHVPADAPNLMHDLTTANIASGGAIIDSGGFNTTISQSLTGSGGLTKNSGGTLVLSGANAYNGATVVNAGKLATTTASTGAGAYSVADGAELQVSLGYHNAQLGMSSFTLANSTAATLDLDLGSFGNPDPGSAPINVSGALAVNGTITLNLADSLPATGQFPLIQYGSRTGSGSFLLGSLPIGVVANLTTNTSGTPNSIDLVVTSAGSPRWDGQVGGVPTSAWDINTTADWIELSTLDPTTYREGNPVLFDDNATGTNWVSLVANVHPGAVTVNNNFINYTLSGPNKISGPTSLTKEGAGRLTIANTTGNDYTGPTVIVGGTVIVTNLANGGSPSAIGASPAEAGNLVISNATLTYSGASVAIDRGYTVRDTNSVIDVEGNLTLSGQTAATAGGATAKMGPAQLTYTTVGTNILSSAPAVRPGYDVRAGTVLFDGSAGAQTNYTASELWVGSTTTDAANLILSNTTLYSASWLGLGRGNGFSGLSSTMTLYNSTYNAGNISVGYDNGVPGFQANPVLTLNGSSVITNRGDSNFGENPGANVTININDTSSFGSANRVLVGMATNATTGLGATGTVTIANSGKLVISAYLSLGNSGGVGSLLMKDNASLTCHDFNVTDSGAGLGTFLIQDTAQVSAANFYVGKGAGSIGTATVNGGTITTISRPGAAEFQIGAYGNGTWTQTGGSVDAKSNYVSVARQSGSVGVMNVSGGSFTESDPTKAILVGEQGTGTLNLSGNGLLTCLGSQLAVGWGNAAFGIVNLDGGNLVANKIAHGTGSSTFNFNGGTLTAGSAASSDFMSGLSFAYVKGGGAVIDTGANTITIAQALLDGTGGGGLTKNGSGALYLNGANTYTGPTVVNNGTLGGNGTIAASVAVAAGATLAPGASVGTLHVGGDLTLAGNLLIEVNKSLVQSNDVTVVGGALTKTGSGTLTVVKAGPALAGGDSFTLFNKPLAGGDSLTITPAPGPGLTWTNRLATDGSIAVLSGGVNTTPTNIVVVVQGNNLTLSWPADHTGWRLLVQTNHLDLGISTNPLDWGPVAGSESTNEVTIPIDQAKPTEFYRLVYP